MNSSSRRIIGVVLILAGAVAGTIWTLSRTADVDESPSDPRDVREPDRSESGPENHDGRSEPESTRRDADVPPNPDVTITAGSDKVPFSLPPGDFGMTLALQVLHSSPPTEVFDRPPYHSSGAHLPSDELSAISAALSDEIAALGDIKDALSKRNQEVVAEKRARGAYELAQTTRKDVDGDGVPDNVPTYPTPSRTGEDVSLVTTSEGNYVVRVGWGDDKALDDLRFKMRGAVEGIVNHARAVIASYGAKK